jgi:hypothetical protein
MKVVTMLPFRLTYVALVIFLLQAGIIGTGRPDVFLLDVDSLVDQMSKEVRCKMCYLIIFLMYYFLIVVNLSCVCL